MQKVTYWPGLDLTKFLCVSSMILIHLFVWALLVPKGLDTSHYLYSFILNFVFLSFFNLNIPATAGSVLGFYLKNNKKTIFRILIISLTIAIIGYAMNLIAFGQRWFFSWNVLQFIAISFIVITLINYFNKHLLLIIAILSLILINPIKQFFSNLDIEFLNIIFIGTDSGLHLWPFFPWFATVVLGFFISDMYIKYRNSKKFILYLSLMGLIFFIISIITGDFLPKINPTNIFGPDLFQPPIGMVLAIIGFYCLLIAATSHYTKNKKFKKYSIINCYSRGILWVYLTLMIVGYRLTVFLSDFFDPVIVLAFTLIIVPILCWIIGALSIKFIQGKKLNIVLRKLSN